MSAGWVAGSVRARAMARRRLGVVGCRTLAASATVEDAVLALSRSPYGRFVRAGDGLPVAQRGIADTLLWNLRVLAGWLPAPGVRVLRLLAGWFELANVDERVRELTAAGAPVDPPFRLGTLATTWPHIATAGSLSQLRQTLAWSPWGDPGADRPSEIYQALRLVWADRVASGVTRARPWAAGGVALMVARDPGAAGRLPLAARVCIDRLLGTSWASAGSVEQLAALVAPPAAWALRGVRSPAELWAAEARWWVRVRTDGARLLAAPGFGVDRALGAAAVLAADAVQARAALETVARSTSTAVREAFDALA